VPLSLQQAIEATARQTAQKTNPKANPSPPPGSPTLGSTGSCRLSHFPPNLETARAFRKSSQLAKSDQREFDQLESEQKERVKKTNPDLDLVALVSESFLRRFGLDSRNRLTEIAEEFGIDAPLFKQRPRYCLLTGKRNISRLESIFCLGLGLGDWGKRFDQLSSVAIGQLPSVGMFQPFDGLVEKIA
jgi:hypothetical protein